jgi:hypothetical protein
MKYKIVWLSCGECQPISVVSDNQDLILGVMNHDEDWQIKVGHIELFLAKQVLMGLKIYEASWNLVLWLSLPLLPKKRIA